MPQRGVPAGAVILLGVLILAGAYVGWYRYSGHDDARVAQTTSIVPDRFADKVPPPPNQSPQVTSLLASGPPLTQPLTPAIGAGRADAPEPMRVPVNVAPPAPAPVVPPSAQLRRGVAGEDRPVREGAGSAGQPCCWIIR